MNIKYLDGNGSQRIEFAQPNVEIVLLMIDGLAIPPSDDGYPGYRLMPEELQLLGYIFPQGKHNVVIVYRTEGEKNAGPTQH